ncbi:MAG: 50S ribosomal protein L4 [Candidatus Saccharibacteria bacterium]|nr:50S ribosomal protein L4 [Candidatus Saccharibacteria bacterium]
MSIPTFTKTGNKATTAAKLDKSIFDVEVNNHALVKQAYVAYQANGRENHAKTLRRGEVRGGGRKPWKQKGTGRARFGSIRVPIWRGGGITFGPLGVENYSRTLTTGTKRQAVRHALSLNKDNIIVVESFESQNGKVSDTVKFLDKIGAKRNILLVVDVKDAKVERATNNLSNVVVSQAMYLNVFNIMNADSIVITEKSLEIIEKWLAKETEAKK